MNNSNSEHIARVLRKFVYRYDACISETLMRRRTPLPYNVSGTCATDFQMLTEEVPGCKVELPVSSLQEIAEKLDEFETLMQDPDVRRAVHQARFINKLSGR